MNDQKDSTIIMPPYSNNNNSDCTSSSSSRGSKPKAALHLSPTRKNNNDELLQLVAQELETMKQPKKQLHDQSSKQPAGQCFSNHPRHHYNEQCFPPACLRLMSSLPGNLTCIDCHSRTDISWASVSFGCLMCLQCSGKHRSLGVQTSFVKSVSMDGWKVHEVLSMLEGGNEQLDQFFERHEMGKSGSVSGDGTTTNNKLTSPTATSLLDRYKTKAASFYRQHLINHAKELGEGGIYKGREASRSKNKKTSSSASSSRKHQRSQQEQQQPSKPKLLPTVTESSASMAESETATSNYGNNGGDDPSPPPLSPSQPLVKRQRSKGSGTNVSMEMSELDLDRME